MKRLTTAPNKYDKALLKDKYYADMTESVQLTIQVIVTRFCKRVFSSIHDQKVGIVIFGHVNYILILCGLTKW